MNDLSFLEPVLIVIATMLGVGLAILVGVLDALERIAVTLEKK